MSALPQLSNPRPLRIMVTFISLYIVSYVHISLDVRQCMSIYATIYVYTCIYISRCRQQGHTLRITYMHRRHPQDSPSPHASSTDPPAVHCTPISTHTSREESFDRCSRHRHPRRAVCRTVRSRVHTSIW